MILSDTAVRRPVFAMVLGLLLSAVGVLSFHDLPVREYPNVVPPVVSISTSYPGASAPVVESQVTQIIEDQVNGIEGVASISSSSSDGNSRITVEFSLDRSLDEAANDIRDRVSRVADRLPDDADPPQISKADSDSRPIVFLNFTSTTLDPMALTDYAERYLVDQLAVIPGVAEVSVSGSGRYAMRVWLDRVAMAARGITVNDIENVLRRENIELPAGRVDSTLREFGVRIDRAYRTADDFRSLVLKRGEDGALVRLGDIARVEVGPSNLRTSYRANGNPRIGVGIVKQSTANTLEVLNGVHERVERINETLPEGTQLGIGSDESLFIRGAIDAVYETIGVTTLLVAAVIFVFLGSLRATVIPVVTIPICLLSAFTIIALFGFTVNLITLLALVLAIGMVVDDAIVVLENIHRRIEEGEPPLLAAFNGARQVAFAVIATTLVVVAVFVPLAFQTDYIGQIFSELAVTVSAALLVSMLLALTLTPMMASKLLRQHQLGRASEWIDRRFERLAAGYEQALRRVLGRPLLAGGVVAVMVGGAAGIFELLPDEFAPTEDQGAVFTRVSGPEGASFPYMREQMLELERRVLPLYEEGTLQQVMAVAPGFGSSQVNQGVVMMTLVPWNQRTRSTQEVVDFAVAAWADLPGVRAFPTIRQGLSRRSGGGPGGGTPVQFVIQGSTYAELAQWRDRIIARAQGNPGLLRVDSDYKETKPELLVRIDRNRAADLGVSTQAIGRTLQTMMSERRITTYVDDGEEYDVIVQAVDAQRASPDDMMNIYVRSDTSGRLIPLSNLVRIENSADASSLNRYNRLRAITISAALAPGYSLGEALEFLEEVVSEELPAIAQVDYKGDSLEYKEATGGLYFTFTLALLVVFLVLAAQFESFVQPAVIMLTVPLAVFGGLLGLLLTDGALNIYSKIGIIMLIGIAAKNGILIVDFINQLRDAGRPFDEAIVEAARLRLRPILMTASATVMGSIPLMLASGPGSESRQTLGIVIFGGVSLATVVTLFIVPVFYRLLARNTGSPGAVAAELERMQTQPGAGAHAPAAPAAKAG
jgi:multidrug efflux pump